MTQQTQEHERIAQDVVSGMQNELQMLQRRVSEAEAIAVQERAAAAKEHQHSLESQKAAYVVQQELVRQQQEYQRKMEQVSTQATQSVQEAYVRGLNEGSTAGSTARQFVIGTPSTTHVPHPLVLHRCS